MKLKRILFISHDASVSGAPILLLHLIKLLKHQRNIHPSIIVRRGGPLNARFSELGKLIVLKEESYSKKKLFHRFPSILRNRIKILQVLIAARKSDIIFSNSIINGKLLKTLSVIKKPVYTYVHELENVIAAYMPSGDSKLSFNYSSAFLYPSEAVKNCLRSIYSVDDKKLFALSYFFPVDTMTLTDESNKQEFASSFREKYGFGKDDFIVGGMGLVSERKGSDIFLAVTKKVVATNSKIKFCWIGGFETVEQKKMIETDLRNDNLADKIIFTGICPPNILNASVFDLLFLSSREDPYPLVVIEAALMKKPTVCFKNAGGITEFVADDAGVSLPSFDIDVAVDTILSLYRDHTVLAEKGQIAFERAVEWHTDPNRIISQLEYVNIRKQ